MTFYYLTGSIGQKSGLQLLWVPASGSSQAAVQGLAEAVVFSEAERGASLGFWAELVSARL